MSSTNIFDPKLDETKEYRLEDHYRQKHIPQKVFRDAVGDDNKVMAMCPINGTRLGDPPPRLKTERPSRARQPRSSRKAKNPTSNSDDDKKIASTGPPIASAVRSAKDATSVLAQAVSDHVRIASPRHLSPSSVDATPSPVSLSHSSIAKSLSPVSLTASLTMSSAAGWHHPGHLHSGRSFDFARETQAYPAHPLRPSTARSRVRIHRHSLKPYARPPPPMTAPRETCAASWIPEAHGGLSHYEEPTNDSHRASAVPFNAPKSSIPGDTAWRPVLPSFMSPVASYSARTSFVPAPQKQFGEHAGCVVSPGYNGMVSSTSLGYNGVTHPVNSMPVWPHEIPPVAPACRLPFPDLTSLAPLGPSTIPGDLDREAMPQDRWQSNLTTGSPPDNARLSMYNELSAPVDSPSDYSVVPDTFEGALWDSTVQMVAPQPLVETCRYANGGWQSSPSPWMLRARAPLSYTAPF